MLNETKCCICGWYLTFYKPFSLSLPHSIIWWFSNATLVKPTSRKNKLSPGESSNVPETTELLGQHQVTEFPLLHCKPFYGVLSRGLIDITSLLLPSPYPLSHNFFFQICEGVLAVSVTAAGIWWLGPGIVPHNRDFLCLKILYSLSLEKMTITWHSN